MGDTELTRAAMKMKAKIEESLLQEFRTLSTIIAKKQKIYYDSLIEQGFEEYLALELVKDARIFNGLVDDDDENNESEL